MGAYLETLLAQEVGYYGERILIVLQACGGAIDLFKKDASPEEKRDSNNYQKPCFERYPSKAQITSEFRMSTEACQKPNWQLLPFSRV